MSTDRKTYTVCWQVAEDGNGMAFERVSLTSAERADLQARLDQLFTEGVISDVAVVDETGPALGYEAFLDEHELLAHAAPEADMVIRALWDALAVFLEEAGDHVNPGMRADAVAAIRLAERFAKRKPGGPDLMTGGVER